MRFLPIIASLTLLLFGCRAHSWVERLMRVDLNGTLMGRPGYIRGAVSRLDSSFNDFAMQHQLPPVARYDGPMIEMPDHICKETQVFGNYSQDLPALRASPGDFIALQYQENGHVTLPEITPQKNTSGRVYIYGTSTPSSEDTLLSIHKVWNEDGTGGNGRGRLLAVRPFDDGRCYQINGGIISTERRTKYPKAAMAPQGADLWCQNDIRLPVDISGYFTLYWVWDWPTLPSIEIPAGIPEVYTSCMDIEIAPTIQQGQVKYVGGQDLNFAGIETQLLGGDFM